jgi:hypothetical protein
VTIASGQAQLMHAVKRPASIALADLLVEAKFFVVKIILSTTPLSTRSRTSTFVDLRFHGKPTRNPGTGLHCLVGLWTPPVVSGRYYYQF